MSNVEPNNFCARQHKTFINVILKVYAIVDMGAAGVFDTLHGGDLQENVGLTKAPL